MSGRTGRNMVLGLEGLEPRSLLSGGRLLGLDVSAWQGDISQTTWNNIRSAEDRRFLFVRASRGGTSSLRYDDPYFVQNVNRAVAAGIFAGSYHYSRPDNVSNTGWDEADHFIQMAGAFMRPGYLPPVLDLEEGDGVRTDSEIAQFSIDFSNRIYEMMRIRPMIYVNGNYAYYVLNNASAALRDQMAKPAAVSPSLSGPAFPQLWTARYPNQTDPNSINVQTGNPNDGLSWLYGPWDDYGVSQPWTFWQYASTGRLQSFNGGASNLDFNVVRGGLEFLKDQLVPAVWWNDLSGDWGSLLNWNSGQNAIVPTRVSGQPAPVGVQALPSPRLPGAAGSSITSGMNDTVILDRPNANVTVTLSSGSYNIRKLYVRETFNMTGGSLTVNYVPSADSTPESVRVSAAVSLSGGARLSGHTISVDPGRTLTAGNASLSFSSLALASGTSPATLALNGNVSVSGGSVISGGRVDLMGGVRTITVVDGTATISAPVVNGGIVKTGPGTLILNNLSVSGPITVQDGRLVLANSSASMSVKVNSGAVLEMSQSSYTVRPGQTLGGNGTIQGDVVFGSGSVLSPGISDPIGTASVSAFPADQSSMWIAYAISQQESTKKRK